MQVKELEPHQLYHRCDPQSLGFETTEQLEGLKGILGQPRAVSAIEFGIDIGRDGFNLFAFGPPGTGKHSSLLSLLRERAEKREIPTDICYVSNLDEARIPRLLELPAGRGSELRRDMARLVDEISTGLSAAFESEQYQTRRQAIEHELAERQQKALAELSEEAREQGLAFLRTPAGIAFAPLKGEEVVSTEEFSQLPEKERDELKKKVGIFEERLRKVFLQFPRWQREKQETVRELNNEIARLTLGPLIAELREEYQGLDKILDYLDKVEADIQKNASHFISPEGGQVAQAMRELTGAQGLEPSFTRRYRVNLLVDRCGSTGAPVVYLDNPTYQNLVGRIEHLTQVGAMITDFNLIRPGALHRANGGFLVLDALKLLQQPYAWEGLKRALLSSQIRIESLGQMLSLISTYSLEPEPVPLSVKVALVGTPMLYHLLSILDPDFSKLFKVAADFDERLDRDDENERLYAQLIARIVEEDELKPFHNTAVAQVIEHGSRAVGDSEKISINAGRIRDLLREADYWAQKQSRTTVVSEDVQRAIDARIYRSDRIRERLLEEMLRETLLVDTDGGVVGQVNGLAVHQIGDFSFGKPSRITARVRLGKGEVIDIEREVDLSGPFHSKGIMILSGFLGARYAPDTPLSVLATLVFEQSYSDIDGDSASSAELFALLSAIANLEIDQSLAVTGSVNQRGDIQAIGGVNEKIEGFFDLCDARGLTGKQGVLIPASNVKHLMLRRNVAQAVDAGLFHIYPLEHIDQGMEILTGLPSGERAKSGEFPEGSVNARVEQRLRELAEISREFGRGRATKSNGQGPDDSSDEMPAEEG